MRNLARHPVARRVAERWLGSGESDRTRQNVLQSAAVPLALFADPRIEAAMSGPSDFAISDFDVWPAAARCLPRGARQRP